MTREDVKKFETERQAHWDALSKWWEEFYRMEKVETARRHAFRDLHGLNKMDSLEFQISEWKRLKGETCQP